MPDVPEPITFAIAGRLPGKQSVRMGKGRAYIPTKSRRAMEAVRAAFELAAPRDWQPWSGPVELLVAIYREPPRSWPKWRRALAMQNRVLDTAKPDVSNVLKGIEDGLKGAAYDDDAQIAIGHQEKRFAPATGVRVKLRFHAALPERKARQERPVIGAARAG